MGLKKRIVGVIGLGHVGAHVAFNLGVMGIADEVRLCDADPKKLASERQDLMDAVMFMPHRVNYTIASFEELRDCDVIVNAIGKISLCASGNRDDEMEFTVPRVAEFIPKIMAGGFQGIFINITNPCDVVTDVIAKKSGLPKGRVFGTGTGLDTSRLVHVLSEETGLEHNSFTAYMLGEHGNAQMAPWSLMNVSGKPLADYEGDPRFAFGRNEMQEKAIKGGWVTYSGKGCTEFGISMTAATMVSAVLHDEKKIMAASAPLDGEYGETGIFCGVPSVLGANGLEKVIEYSLPDDEMKKFKACCQTIRENIARAEALWK